MKKKLIASVILLTVVYSIVALASKASATDPLPQYSYGQEISRLESARGQSQSAFEATSAFRAFVCPDGSSMGGGVDMNYTTDRSDDFYYVYCVKTYSEVVATVTPTPTPTATPNSVATDTTTATTSTSTSTTTSGSSTTDSNTSTATTTMTKAEMYAKIMLLFQQLMALLAQFAQ